MSVVIIRPEIAPVRTAREHVELKLGFFQRLWNSGFVRKAILIVLLGLIWKAMPAISIIRCCFRRSAKR